MFANGIRMVTTLSSAEIIAEENKIMEDQMWGKILIPTYVMQAPVAFYSNTILAVWLGGEHTIKIKGLIY